LQAMFGTIDRLAAPCSGEGNPPRTNASQNFKLPKGLCIPKCNRWLQETRYPQLDAPFIEAVLCDQSAASPTTARLRSKSSPGALLDRFCFWPVPETENFIAVEQLEEQQRQRQESSQRANHKRRQEDGEKEQEALAAAAGPDSWTIAELQQQPSEQLQEGSQSPPRSEQAQPDQLWQPPQEPRQ